MSEQNNYQQGYPQQYQQMNQQGYPQQQYQQMNQQGYPQQQYQQLNQQGYPQQQYQQMNQQGYPQQSYQQPTGGGTTPPKGNKPKTGLIVGIIIAAVVLVVGIVLILFKDKIFGSDDEKTTETTEMTTEITTEDILTPDVDNPDITTEATVDDEGGFDTPEELITGFWQGFEDCDKEKIYQCFFLESSQAESDAEYNYNLSLSMDSTTEVHVDRIVTTFEDCDASEAGTAAVAAKKYHCVVPLTQEIEGVTYEVNDIYDGVVAQLENGKWYLVEQKETDVEIVSQTGDSGSTDTQTTGDTKPMGSVECGYVDVPTDWMDFAEAGGIDGTEASYQTCSSDMSIIVTMCVYSDIDPYTAACNIYEGIAAEGNTSDLVSAMATIGGYEAYQVYAVYSDLYLVTYCFTADDGKTHYVAIEFPLDQAGSPVIQNIETSYRLEQ